MRMSVSRNPKKRGWDDQQVEISGIRLPASQAPSWTSYKGSEVLTFSGSATNKIFFSAELSHEYISGTNIKFHIHLVFEDNTAGNTRWVFTYSWANLEGIFPTENTETKIIATSEVTDKHSKNPIVEIAGEGKKLSGILLCSLARTGNHGDDTYNGKGAYLIAADFHRVGDSSGSRLELIK